MPEYPPNPLPCGCGAKGVLDLENAVETGDSLRVGHRSVHVVHCSLHAAAPALVDALSGLTIILTTIREEQVSVRMGFGRTDAERKQNAAFYAAEIAHQAAKIDDALSVAEAALALAKPKE